jgi:hypothetical protein
MRKLIFIFGFSIPFVSCNHDSKRDKIFSLSKDELIKQISAENVVAGSAVGIGGIEPAQWVRYLALKNKTTEQELIDLTNHPNSTVKCYAFDALIETKSKDIFNLVLTNISDTQKVRTFYGCILSALTVGDFFVNEVYSSELIGKTQKQILDSIIAFDENVNLTLKSEVLETMSPSPDNYILIKKRLSQDPNYVIPLSKYKNPADREIISNLLKSTDRSIQSLGFRAVTNYPDKSFFPRLIEIAKANFNTLVDDNRNYLSVLYKALVQYKNQSSKNVLKEAIQKASGMDSIRKIDLIYDALKNYPDSIYKNLIQYF